MKIIHFIPSLSKGGAEGFLFRLLKEQSKNKKNYNLYVLTLFKESYYDRYLIKQNIKIINFNLTHKLFIFFKLYKIY